MGRSSSALVSVAGISDARLTSQTRVTERRPVELVDHSPDWAARARTEATRLGAALGPTVVVVHHVGSTAIPGIRAKPIIDLLAEVASLDALDANAAELRALGYEWRGEFGIGGRRYCTLNDPVSGARLAQLHAFATGHPEITRMLVFRDYLRAHPDEARAYGAEKERLRQLHPNDTIAYASAKTPWIRALETRAGASADRGSSLASTRNPEEPARSRTKALPHRPPDGAALCDVESTGALGQAKREKE